MKSILAIIGLVVCTNIYSTSSEAAATPILTESDCGQVLQIIDRVCADSWCSGDYDYKFSTFSCNDNTAVCTLTFKIIDRDAKPPQNAVRNRRCIFKGLNTKEKILTGDNLNEEFYDQLNICVSSRESK